MHLPILSFTNIKFLITSTINVAWQSCVLNDDKQVCFLFLFVTIARSYVLMICLTTVDVSLVKLD